MKRLHNWMNRLNKLMDERTGLDTYDLDAPYEEYFENGMTAKEAARTVLEDNGFPWDEEPCLDDGFALMALGEDDHGQCWDDYTN